MWIITKNIHTSKMKREILNKTSIYSISILFYETSYLES